MGQEKSHTCTLVQEEASSISEIKKTLNPTLISQCIALSLKMLKVTFDNVQIRQVKLHCLLKQ